LKIGFIFDNHPSDVRYSVTRVSSRICSALARWGDEIVAFYPVRKPTPPSMWEGIKVVPVVCDWRARSPRLGAFELPYRVAGLLDSSYDVVICTAELGATPLFNRARELGMVSVDWLHGIVYWFLRFSQRTALKDLAGLAVERVALPRIEMFNARRADLVVACSNRNREDLIKHYKVPSSRIAVLRNGFDPVAPGTEEERSRAREVLKLDPNCRYASFVGAAAYRKGIDVLQEAVRMARKRGLPWRILNVGNRKGDSDEEIGYGYVDEEMKRRIMIASDAFVFPTRYEGSPLPIPEAAALGLPIVATPDACIDVGVPGKDYLLVPTGNPSALADTLELLYRHPEQAREIAASGHKTFSTWTWEDQARGLRQVLRDALANSHGKKQSE
jgi:glycosyltransferase involved in cell wall biosynthesis